MTLDYKNAWEMVFQPVEKPTQHSIEEIEAIVQQFVDDKLAVAGAEKPLLRIFNGTVGAGKTRAMHLNYEALSDDEKQLTVIGTVDEFGALFAMDKYQQDFKLLPRDENEQVSLEDRMNVRDKYQDDSQYVFYRVQQEALKIGANVWLDMTMSGKFALKALDPYLSAGYEVQLDSYFSPKQIAEDRVNSRQRALWPEEFSSKYKDWFANAGNLANAGHKLNLHYNPSNDAEPTLAATFNNGQIDKIYYRALMQAATDLRATEEAKPFIQMINRKLLMR